MFGERPSDADGGASAVQYRVEPEEVVGRKRILIINTRSSLYDSAPGASEQSDPELFERELFAIDDLRKPGMPEFAVRHLPELGLSADQGHKTWTAIADIIESEYHKYSGFVVQHGTDTMVYTGTALSFMLENLGKPVMLTGSLVPANRVHSDMKRNIILAMLFAQNEDICEVCIVFAERLFRASRTIKVSRNTLQPYATPFVPPLAVLRGNQVTLERRLLREAPRGRLRVHKDMSSVILTIKLTPGFDATVAMRLIEVTRARAMVLCGFGSGNVPVRSGYVVSMAKAALEKNIVVVVCTQNRFGAVSLESYETGQVLRRCGAIGAGDMTIEAVIVKLKFLFGLGLHGDSVRSMLLQDFHGEVSASQTSSIAHL